MSARTPTAAEASADASVRLPARYYAQLCEWLQARGHPLMPGITIDALRHPDATLSIAQMEALIAHAAATTGRDDLGVVLGRMITPSSHAMLGYGVLCSATLAAGLQLAARHYDLISPLFALHCRSNGAQFEALHVPVHAMSAACLRFHVDVLVVACHALVAHLFGERARDYAIRVGGAAGDLRRFGPPGVPIRAVPNAAPMIELVLDRALADHPLPLADRHTAALVDALCSSRPLRAARCERIGDWVTMVLRATDDRMPSLDELAAMRNVAPHTLDRRLRAEGVCFRTLSTRLRHERACEHLRDRRLSLTEIALRLGYSDPGNFTRAFRRVAGVTPSEYRRGRNSSPLPAGPGKG